MNDCVWLLALLATNGLLLWSAKMRYEHGVWDGAFNRFIPHVQKAMIDYDADRAFAVLEEDGIEITQEVLDYAAWEHHKFPRATYHGGN